MSGIAIAWAVVGALVAVAITIGGSVMSMTPPDFYIARWSFSIATVALSIMTIVWAIRSDESSWWRIFASASCGITAFILFPETLRWIQRRQTAQARTTILQAASPTTEQLGTNTVAADSLAVTQRARVVFQGVSRTELTAHAIARVVLTNIGVHPALDAHGEVFTGVSNMLPPEGAIDHPTRVRDVILSKTVIAPGNWVEMPIALTITEADKSAVLNGTKWLLIFGYITYDDGFGTHRRTRFCQFYDRTDGLWSNCPANNTFE